MNRLFAPIGMAVAASACLIAPCSAERADHIIHISVDGLRSDLLADLLANDTTGQYAGFQRFIDEGAATLNARTDAEHTRTLPNHATMLTGRPVLQPPAAPPTTHHGYTSNEDPAADETLHNSGNPAVPYFASVFDVVHDHGLSTALYASKTKFILFDRSWDAAHGAPDLTGADNGPDKIDVYVRLSAGSPANAAPMHAAFLADMAAQDFNYAFLHYRDLDTAGHDFGWGSPTWNAAAADVAGYLSSLLDLVETDPDLAGRTLIILSADHGGTGTDHGNINDQRNYTIPFFVWGPGVPAGVDLYALSAPTRQDPGTSRPGYDAPVQPIRNGDGGNLALDLLGLPPIPGSTINAAQDLIVQQCPCERTGDIPAAVDVLDLLAYLDAWFAADPAAELTGDDGGPLTIDVFDLLAYLDCWFPASSGAACP